MYKGLISRLMHQVRKQQGQGPSGGQWFCFDDNTVEPWDISKLDTECFGGKESESRAAQGLPTSPQPLGVCTCPNLLTLLSQFVWPQFSEPAQLGLCMLAI